MNTQVTNYIENSPSNQKEIMEAIIAILNKTVEGLEVEYKWSRPVFGYKGKGFCYLQKNKNHVTLGFTNFEKLGEEANNLEGSGTQMRHLKIKSINEVDEQQFTRWFKLTTE
jgi:hypothetical protein